jgi:thiosulfate dehydrogenase [quinone] large subunit
MKKLSIVPEASCTRRALLGGLGACAALAAVRGAAGCTPGSNLSTATGMSCGAALCINLNSTTNAPLTKVGGAMLVSPSSGDTLVVIRTSETEVVALDAICPHLGCTLGFDASTMLLVCPCHGAKFDETGSAVAGPTTIPLTPFTATLIDNTITITG